MAPGKNTTVELISVGSAGPGSASTLAMIDQHLERTIKLAVAVATSALADEIPARITNALNETLPSVIVATMQGLVRTLIQQREAELERKLDAKYLAIIEQLEARINELEGRLYREPIGPLSHTEMDTRSLHTILSSYHSSTLHSASASDGQRVLPFINSEGQLVYAKPDSGRQYSKAFLTLYGLLTGPESHGTRMATFFASESVVYDKTVIFESLSKEFCGSRTTTELLHFLPPVCQKFFSRTLFPYGMPFKIHRIDCPDGSLLKHYDWTISSGARFENLKALFRSGTKPWVSPTVAKYGPPPKFGTYRDFPTPLPKRSLRSALEEKLGPFPKFGAYGDYSKPDTKQTPPTIPDEQKQLVLHDWRRAYRNPFVDYSDSESETDESDCESVYSVCDDGDDDSGYGDNENDSDHDKDDSGDDDNNHRDGDGGHDSGFDDNSSGGFGFDYDTDFDDDSSDEEDSTEEDEWSCLESRLEDWSFKDKPGTEPEDISPELKAFYAYIDLLPADCQFLRSHPPKDLKQFLNKSRPQRTWKDTMTTYGEYCRLTHDSNCFSGIVRAIYPNFWTFILAHVSPSRPTSGNNHKSDGSGASSNSPSLKRKRRCREDWETLPDMDQYYDGHDRKRNRASPVLKRKCSDADLLEMGMEDNPDQYDGQARKRHRT